MYRRPPRLGDMVFCVIINEVTPGCHERDPVIHLISEGWNSASKNPQRMSVAGGSETLA
jgi:hypothetical protein